MLYIQLSTEHGRSVLRDLEYCAYERQWFRNMSDDLSDFHRGRFQNRNYSVSMPDQTHAELEKRLL